MAGSSSNRANAVTSISGSSLTLLSSQRDLPSWLWGTRSNDDANSDSGWALTVIVIADSSVI
jgi:hypothetical protein